MSPADTVPDPRIVLFSDWHLPPEAGAQTEFFVRFVEQVCRDAAGVFVLGDLFRAWVGPKHAARTGHATVLEALGGLVRSGTPVTLLRGNRDFLLDRGSVRRFGITLAGNTWRGDLNGKAARLSHGDELCEDDRLHKCLRVITANPPVSTLVKWMPLRAADGLAEFYRGLSDRRRARRKTRKLRPDESQIRAQFRAGVDLLVIGHWHEPCLETDALGLPGKTFVMLGEGTETGASYAEILGETIQLKTFPGP